MIAIRTVAGVALAAAPAVCMSGMISNLMLEALAERKIDSAVFAYVGERGSTESLRTVLNGEDAWLPEFSAGDAEFRFEAHNTAGALSERAFDFDIPQATREAPFGSASLDATHDALDYLSAALRERSSYVNVADRVRFEQGLPSERLDNVSRTAPFFEARLTRGEWLHPRRQSYEMEFQSTHTTGWLELGGF